MPLKRLVTLAQARRWPAAAKRRESFCARMGGMRELLTGERAALDPASPINRALAAWDCDEPEMLKREHVSKGIRMKITKGKVGSEAKRAPARKNPKMTPRQQVTRWSKDMGLRTSSGDGWVSISDTRSDWSETFDNWTQAMEWARRAYDAKRDEGKPWPWETRQNPAKKPTVSQKVSQLYREGYPQKQAVAIALSEQRAGKVRKNPPTYAVVKIGARTPLAVFATRADAVAFGQSWADIHKTPVQVVAA